jgi:hypothetical protein
MVAHAKEKTGPVEMTSMIVAKKAKARDALQDPSKSSFSLSNQPEQLVTLAVTFASTAVSSLQKKPQPMSPMPVDITSGVGLQSVRVQQRKIMHNVCFTK